MELEAKLLEPVRLFFVSLVHIIEVVPYNDSGYAQGKPFKVVVDKLCEYPRSSEGFRLSQTKDYFSCHMTDIS